MQLFWRHRQNQVLFFFLLKKKSNEANRKVDDSDWQLCVFFNKILILKMCSFHSREEIPLFKFKKNQTRHDNECKVISIKFSNRFLWKNVESELFLCFKLFFYLFVFFLNFISE